jgi:hypothetical protein
VSFLIGTGVKYAVHHPPPNEKINVVNGSTIIFVTLLPNFATTRRPLVKPFLRTILLPSVPFRFIKNAPEVPYVAPEYVLRVCALSVECGTRKEK